MCIMDIKLDKPIHSQKTWNLLKLLNFIKVQKLGYFGHIKIHEKLERSMEGKWNAKEADEDQKDRGRRMWRTGWKRQLWDKQQNIG